MIQMLKHMLSISAIKAIIITTLVIHVGFYPDYCIHGSQCTSKNVMIWICRA